MYIYHNSMYNKGETFEIFRVVSYNNYKLNNLNLMK